MWRTSWLPHSETFIANQTAALRRWRPLTVGVRRLPDGLPIVPDHAPFGNTFRSRVAHKISSSIGYRGAFDGWLKAQGVQLIHAHFGPGGIKVLPIARRTGIPLAVTFHGFDATTAAAEKGPVGDRYRAQLAELFAGADRLIAVSEFIRGRLLELGAPESKTVVHYIGIPVDGAAVEASADGADGRAIVVVGRLVPVQGCFEHLRLCRKPCAQQRHSTSSGGGRKSRRCADARTSCAFRCTSREDSRPKTLAGCWRRQPCSVARRSLSAGKPKHSDKSSSRLLRTACRRSVIGAVE